MFRKILLISLMLVFLLGSFSLPAPAQEPIATLSFAALTTLPHPWAQSAFKFAELVEEKTDGKIKVVVYPSAQLGGEYEYVQGLQLGTIDVCITAIASFAGITPKLEILSLPFLFRNYDHFDSFRNSEVGEELASLMSPHGFELLSWHESGSQGFYNSQRPITSIDDIKGLSMRTIESTVMTQSMTSYGARPTPLAFPEFYSAMQTGVVAGGENSILVYETASHYEVARYYTASRHRILAGAILISQATLNRIPVEYHDVLYEAAIEASEIGMEAGRDMERELELTIGIKYDVDINFLSDEAKEEFVASVQELYNRTAARVGMEDALQQIIDLD